MHRILILLTTLLLVFTEIAFSDATGNWMLDMEGPMGPEQWKLNINADGTVDGEHFIFGSMKGTHKCEVDKWNVYFKADLPMGELEFNFLGELSHACSIPPFLAYKVPT